MMVDYNFSLPQQQYYQAPDFTQNALRQQQMQANAIQMQQALRQQQQQNALAELMGSGIDMNSPEFRQKAFAVGGLSAVPYAQAAAAMRKEDIAAKAEAAREGRYMEQAQTAKLERELKVGQHFFDQLPGVLSSSDPAAAWAKWYETASAAMPGKLTAPAQYPGEEAAKAYMMKAGDFLKSAQEQLQVMSGPGGAPIVANKKTGTFQMATEVPPGGAPPAGAARAPAMPEGFDMGRAKQAIAGIESGGKYDALGPITRGGDRAYGKYQVMGSNIPAWTKEALGRSMTPDEFLNSPEAQEKVFETQFGKSVAKYGNPADAASVWFSGRPLSKAGNASDVLGTTVPQYAQKFMAAYEGGPNTPTMMRAPGFASSSGIPANVGLPVQPVLNALANAPAQQPANAMTASPANVLAMQPAGFAPASVTPPAQMTFQQAQQAAAQRALEQKKAETLVAEQARADVARSEEEKTRGIARADFQTTLDEMAKQYRELGQKGMLIKPGETGIVDRAKALASAKAPDTTTLFSPERSENVNTLANFRLSLMTALMAATGMTSSQINSDTELSKYLDAMSSPGQPVKSIVDTINNLSTRYGQKQKITVEDLTGGAPQTSKSEVPQGRKAAPSTQALPPIAEGIDPRAIAKLKANPSTAAAFDAHFGRPGAAAAILGQ